MKKNILLLLFLSLFIPLFIDAATTNTELDSAISWMNQNGLTKYSNKTDFDANRNIQRNEAAKFFSQFSKNIKGETISGTTTYCNTLKDVPNNSLSGYIMDTCNKGYIKGSKGNFNPTAPLSNEQAVTIVIRIFEGNKDELGKRWSDSYYERANELGLLNNISLNNRSAFITRGNLGILMYRLGQLKNNQNLLEVREEVKKYIETANKKKIMDYEDKEYGNIESDIYLGLDNEKFTTKEVSDMLLDFYGKYQFTGVNTYLKDLLNSIGYYYFNETIDVPLISIDIVSQNDKFVYDFTFFNTSNQLKKISGQISCSANHDGGSPIYIPFNVDISPFKKYDLLSNSQDVATVLNSSYNGSEYVETLCGVYFDNEDYQPYTIRPYMYDSIREKKKNQDYKLGLPDLIISDLEVFNLGKENTRYLFTFKNIGEGVARIDQFHQIKIRSRLLDIPYGDIKPGAIFTGELQLPEDKDTISSACSRLSLTLPCGFYFYYEGGGESDAGNNYYITGKVYIPK